MANGDRNSPIVLLFHLNEVGPKISYKWSYGAPNWRIIRIGLGYVVNNHGDRFRPLFLGLWDPFQMAFFGGLLTTY